MADQDLIERFARECGVWSYPGARIGDSDGFNAGLRRFAALVAGECDAQLRNTSVLYSDPLQSAAARDAGNAIRLKFGAGELGAMAGDHPRQVQGADALLIMTLPCQTSGWIGWEVWESDPAGPIRLDGEFTAEELERVTRQMREAATSATAQWSCSGSTDGLEEAPCTQMESLKNRRV